MSNLKHNIFRISLKKSFFLYRFKIKRGNRVLKPQRKMKIFQTCLPFLNNLFGNKFLRFENSIITPDPIVFEGDNPT